MPSAESHPYSRLTPDVVLDALDSVALRGDGRMLGLNSYENRVYQVMMEEGPPVVVKFYRPERWSGEQILEEHAFALELAGREIPVVAPLVIADRTLHEFAGFRFAVYPRRGGRTPELEDPKVLEWIGRFLGRIHAVGEVKPFATRPALDPASFGLEPRDWLLAHGFLPADLREAWTSVARLALEAVERCFAQAGAARRIRLHGDCHAGNILWTEPGGAGLESPSLPRHGGPHFVDLDDCRSGPAVQDLWMLLSGDRASMAQALHHVLAGYEQFRDFDRRELVLVEALRTLRLIHYSAWIARRWDDPAFPAAFPWFGTQRYWQDRVLELREQVALMDEPPLRPD
jgi:Ser/Thr protein kinase RdoA (MazF antagonist)